MFGRELSVFFLAFGLLLALRADALPRGGWENPPGGWDYVYEARAGEDKYVAGDNVVGLLDGTWAQHLGTSYWDGSAPGVFNTTQTDPNGMLLPPAPGGVKAVCPGGEVNEDGLPLCYLLVEDVGDPTTGFTPAYADPSNRKLYFHHEVAGNSEDGWTLAARMRLSPQAVDPNVNMTAGHNGGDVTDLPMVGVHDGGEGTVGFSINDAGKLVVLSDGVDHEIDIGNPTQWVTIWMSATERGGAPEGRYDVKVYVNGSAAPALTLSAAQAPLSEVTGSPDDWICLGSGRTAADASFQLDYLAYKAGAWDPGQSTRCPSGFACGVTRLAGRAAVDLNWAIPAATTYDGFDLKRDGAILAAGLPGTTTFYPDPAPLPGLHTYELVARSGAVTCNATCQEAMCLYSLVCSFRPGAVGGLVDARLDWSNPGGIDGISVRRRLQREGDLGETDEELGVLPGDASSFRDQSIPTDDLTRITYTVTATIGTTTCEVQCRPTTCPHDLLCEVDASGPLPAVDLKWAADRPFSSMTVSRRTDPAQPFELRETLAGDATGYRDAGVSPLVYYEYEVLGLQSGTAEACGGAVCGIFITREVASYQPPAGGWDYVFDAEAAGSDRYHAVAGEPGALDGNWIRSVLEDHWDGSRPGDTGPAPAGPVPGGIARVAVSAGDPCRQETRQALLLEDVGDPRLLGYPDPNSNRKLLLGYDLGSASENLLRNGVTFSFRMRLTPRPVDIPAEPGNLPWDGDAIAKGLGMVGIYFRNPGAPELGASAGFAVALDEAGAELSTNPTLRIPGIHPEEFHSVWVTIRDPEADGNYAIDLYLDGSQSPIAIPGALQELEPGVVGNDPGFGAGVVNFMAVGLPNTGTDASVQIDYLAWKSGVHAPLANFCGGQPGARFKRGDADGNGDLDLTDVVNTLSYLFLGGTPLRCLDAADNDDNGVIEITDAVISIDFQFLGGLPPSLPGPLACGQDVKPDDLPDCSYDPTKC